MNPSAFGIALRTGSRIRPEAAISYALALVTLVLYWPVVGHDFVNYDDGLYVTENARVQAGLTLDNIRWAFSTGHASNWHPVTWLSHMIDFALFGWFAGGHHLVNVLFHTVNSLLLFLLLGRMTGALGRSAIVAALFAWHPLHVESVAWVAERKDVLSVLFLLLSLSAYVRYVKEPTRRRYGLSLAWFALGLMAKPMIVTLPCLLLLLDWWPLGRLRPHAADTIATSDSRSTLWRLVREKLPFFALAAASCVLTIGTQHHTGALRTLQAVPLSTRLANCFTAYATYLGKMIWPADLAVLYPMPSSWPPALVVGSALALAGISFFAWRQRRHAPWLALGWAWYLGTLVPVIGLVQVGEQAMADRYTYLPLIGMFLALTWGAAALLQYWQVNLCRCITLTAIPLGACLLLTARQLDYWSGSRALFEHAIAVTQNNPVAHNNLGLALAEGGRTDEAIRQYVAALRLQPAYLIARNNLAVVFAESGRLNEAVAQLSEALRQQPNDPVTHNNLGSLLAQQQRWPEAIDQFRNALLLQPDYPMAHLHLAEALARLGQTAEAIAQCREALRLKPKWPQALEKLDTLLAAP